ncbi:MAG: N-6 DNA methylase [Synergistaceae bacterium]|nr:N-6 DNA methylase [Synergistaceae bacterium]
MAMSESNFDMYIHDLLSEAGITADYQHTEILRLQEALAAASKSQTGEQGRPDFIAVVNEYVLVIEDKADRAKLCLKDSDGGISRTPEAVKNYAVNGAVWYARKILEHGAYTKVFAFGNAGYSKHHILMPVFVGLDGVKELDEIETFENFSEANIERYYRQKVLEEESPEELQLENLRKKSRELHEHLRNYGGLRDTEKPLVVSAILLALSEHSHGFSVDLLKGDTMEGNTDGEILYKYLQNAMTRAKVSPEVKRDKVLNQFTIIKDRPILNAKRDDLKMTPLKFFADYLKREIYSAIEMNATSEDYLGRFYGEFVRYSGGDGQTLGVVLTPRHITELFCDLVNLRPDDVIYDPCCGTGGFLIAGMHRMLQEAESESQRKHIKERQIFGTEIRNDMFAIATTNMILRGDGQSNLTCEDFFAKDPGDLQLKGITVGFMNPPYSQAKNKATQNLSELNFICRLLDCVLPGGRAAVIVPVSAMIGKTKEDKLLKSDILKHHTLEGVISLNKQTFYGVGTVPCIAVFTAGEPHPKGKLSKFVNFEDDGWVVKMHVGELTETERAKDRRQYLLDCWRGERKDYPSKFMVETQVEAGDEWLHSFYYYNDELPNEAAFSESMGDYLTFEANMIFHGRGYLFGSEGDAHT